MWMYVRIVLTASPKIKSKKLGVCQQKHISRGFKFFLRSQMQALPILHPLSLKRRDVVEVQLARWVDFWGANDWSCLLGKKQEILLCVFRVFFHSSEKKHVPTEDAMGLESKNPMQTLSKTKSCCVSSAKKHRATHEIVVWSNSKSSL